MIGRIASAIVAVCLITAVAQAQAPRNNPGDPAGDRTAVARPADEAATGVGVVQYDPGAPADVLLVGVSTATATTANRTYYVGNLFDTRNGAPLSPGTITQISWYFGMAGTALVEIWYPGTSIGTQIAASGAASTFNVINITYPMPSPRFVGLALGFDIFGSLGLRSASTNAQGFHGIQRNFAGTVSNTLPGQNSMVRIAGSIIVPVELLEFDVE